MGSLNTDAGRLAAFTGQPYPNGLDLGRCVIMQDLGVFLADPAATFRQGQIVTKGAAGITAANKTNAIGVAKWNKATSLKGVVVDEPVVLVATTASNLKFANVSNVRVQSAANQGGSTYVVTTDYTVNATNGTVTRNGAGGITSGATVYVSYTYDMTDSQFDFQGRNFWNFLDDSTIQDGRITVITDWSILFTTQYDTTLTYAVGTALYSSATGLWTTDSTGGAVKLGSVLQAPTASDPFLGVIYG